MARLGLKLLGGFEARLASDSTVTLPAKAQALLAYLALEAGQAHPRAKLATLLWADSGAPQARASLRQTLSTIGSALAGTTPLVTADHAIALDATAIDVDVAAFERAVAEGAPESLERAVALYRGDLLEGLGATPAPFEEWLLTERERLRELALEALAKLLAEYRERGRGDEAVRTALRLLSLDPLQEPGHRTLMRLYAAQGRRGSALRQYQICVEMLQRELGVEPESETKALYQEIVRSPEPPATTDTREHRHEALAGSAPLIGRETELARLCEQRRNVWQSAGRITFVLGEAGIGKSRLIDELAANSLGDGGRLLIGRAYETARALPFGPWVDAVRSGGVIGEIEAEDALDVRWRVELGRLFPELARGKPRTRSYVEDHVRLFEAFAQLIGHLAARQPLLLVLEDLHWADEMSLRLLSFVGRRAREWRVLVIATLREEELMDAPLLRQVLTELRRERHAREVRLAPLSRADTVSLVRALQTTEASATDLDERIWAVSEGNPFVVVETVQALREGGMQTPSTLPVPEGVRELVAGRLGRLGAGARDVAAVAAVIGREFDFALLEHAARLGEDATAAAVEELVSRRVLHVVGERLDFTHERLRQGASDALLQLRRRLLHGQVAEAIETLYADDLDPHFAALASHYTTRETWAKAVEYLIRFARKAARSFAHADAVTALQAALGYLERLPADDRDGRLVEIVPALARSLFYLNRAGEALELVLGQQDRVDRLGNPMVTGRYCLLLATTYVSLGDSAKTADCARRAIEAASLCGDSETVGKAAYMLGIESVWPGRFREGLEHGLRAVQSFEGTKEPGWLALAYWVVGISAAGLGEFERAQEAYACAQRIGDEIGDPRLQTPVLWLAGLLHIDLGEYAESIEVCTRGLAAAADPLNRALAAGFLGFAYLESGDAARAIPLLEEAAAHFGESRWPQYGGWFVVFLSEAHVLNGDLEKARALSIQGLQMTRDAKHWFAVGWAQRALGLVARANGALTEAEAHFEEAVRIFTSLEARYCVARIHLELGTVAHLRGKAAEASSHLTEAHRTFTALHVPRYVGRTEALGAQLGLPVGDASTRA
jgi:DNA-binding SARP family transcriptional activator